MNKRSKGGSEPSANDGSGSNLCGAHKRSIWMKTGRNKTNHISLLDLHFKRCQRSLESFEHETAKNFLRTKILERILLSSKRTKLHDDVLHILYMHLDPMLPFPRLQMISVLYHVLGVVPAFQASIGPALNELCIGLQVDDAANALYGVYSKDVHVRMACLNAVKCIPAVSECSLPQNQATNFWIALHDPEKLVAEAADDI